MKEEKKIIKNIIKSKKKNEVTKDYSTNFEVEKLYLSIIIVTRYQGDYFVNEFLKLGCSSSFIWYGEGTAPSEIIYTLGLPESKKDVVLTVFKESLKEDVDKIIDERFSFSSSSKGISFNIKLDSVIGVLSYRFLSDTRENRRKDNGK